ncbi:MAG: PEP-CTERM system TPR-repeat protein PrsT, partial [Gammaproteobacteria bacterium]|nr:PEP-CTERM system TPR-repeat protein PrsT [Gammaproteobacteria bacterium]
GQVSARILMGRIELTLGNVKAAEDALLMAQQLGADPALTALPLARARNRLGKHAQNIEQLIPTAFQIIDQPDLWVELGIARLESNDSAGAAIAFEQALALQPAHAGATVGLARIPLKRGQFAEAAALAQDAVTGSPEYAPGWFVLASAQHAQGHFSDAADAYARALALDPGDSAAALGEATALLDGGLAEQAAARLSALRKSHPWMPEAPYLQAKALRQLQRDAEAEQAIAAAAEILDPIAVPDLADNPALLRLAGILALENGSLERAYQAMSLYLQTRPGDAGARILFARVAMRLEKPADAKRVLVPLVTDGRADAEVLGMLGDASAQEHDFITAESYFRRAIADHGGGPALIGRLGALQYRQGKRERALSTLQAIATEHGDRITTGTSLYAAMISFAEGDHEAAAGITDRVLAREPDNLNALNLRAALAIAGGQHDSARQQLEVLLERAPGFRPAQYNLAKLDTLQRRYGEAATRLLNMFEQDPTDQRALHELARTELARGEPRAAIQRYEQLRGLNPGSLVAVSELIELYLGANRPADADAAARALLASLPDSVPVHHLLARTQIADGRVVDARVTLKKASTLAGYDPRQLLQTALLQRAAAAFDDATWTLSKVLEEQPGSLDALRVLADIRLRQNDMPAATKLAGQILEQAPSDLFALTLQGDLLLAAGRPEDAVGYYERAIAVAPKPLLQVSRFRALTLAGEGEMALRELTAWQAEHPDQAVVLKALAERHHQLGQAEQAVSYYERLLLLSPSDTAAINNLANLLFDSDSEYAFRMAGRALALAPDDPAVLDTMGWAMVQIGDVQKGIAHLRDAVARNGRSAVSRYHLGVALEEYGSPGEARRQLQQALKFADGDMAWISDAEMRLQRLR